MVRPGYKRTEVGEIPEDWDCPLLDTITSRASGHTPDKAYPEYWDGPIAWISLQDTHRLDRPLISETAATITEAGIRNSSACLLPAGTVVLSRDAGVGRSSIMSRSMAVSQHFMAWTCGPKLNNHFLYYWLQRTKPEFERIAIGNTIKTIGVPYFKALRVPLPPRPQQDRIALALGESDALIESLEHLLAKKRAIKQGAMQSLLTGAKRLPGFSEPWETRRLDNLGEVVMGQSPSSQHYNVKGQGLPLIQGNADISGRQTLRRVFTRDVTKRGRQGDILMSVRAPVGEVSRAMFDVCLGRGVCAIRSPSPLLYYTLIALEPTWVKFASGTTFESVNGNTVKATLVLMPSDAREQAAIAEVLTDLDADLDATTAKLHKARAIKQGMMQKLLTGRIRLV